MSDPSHEEVTLSGDAVYRRPEGVLDGTIGEASRKFTLEDYRNVEKLAKGDFRTPFLLEVQPVWVRQAETNKAGQLILYIRSTEGGPRHFIKIRVGHGDDAKERELIPLGTTSFSSAHERFTAVSRDLQSRSVSLCLFCGGLLTIDDADFVELGPDYGRPRVFAHLTCYQKENEKGDDGEG